MYVLDYSNSRLQLFPPGILIVFLPIGYVEYLILCSGSGSSTSATTVAGFTLAGGSGNSELNGPTAVVVDLSGTMYILDALNYRVQKWISGQPLGFTVAGGHGSGSTLDKISTSYGLWVDIQSNIYISDSGNNRIVFWTAGNTVNGSLVSYFLSV